VRWLWQHYADPPGRGSALLPGLHAKGWTMTRELPFPRNQMLSRPTWRCRAGHHCWEGTTEHRRCTDCLKVELRSDGRRGPTGKWYSRKQYNHSWCTECGNEMVGCPYTECIPVEGGASRVRYTCGKCGAHSTFDYGLAPVAIKVEDDA
jgi:hypothetical protein